MNDTAKPEQTAAEPTLPPHPSTGTGERCGLCGQTPRQPRLVPPHGNPHEWALACQHCDTPCPIGKKRGCSRCAAAEHRSHPGLDDGPAR